MNEQIESVIKNALLGTSKSMGIDLKSLRIQMKLNNGQVSCYAMQGAELRGEVSWNKILGIKYLAFKGLIMASIEKRLNEISKELQINESEVNARFYAIDKNGTPNVYLFNGHKGIKQIELNELV